MTVYGLALRRAAASPLNYVVAAAVPIGLAFLPAVPGWGMPMGFRMYGAVLLFSAFMLVRSLVDDAASGVLERIAAAPLTRLAYHARTLLAHATVLAVQAALMVGLGVLVHGGALPPPLPLLAAYLAFAFASLAISLAGAAVLGSREAAYQGLPAFLMLLSLVGGFFWPIEALPPILKIAARATPCYYLDRAVGLLTVEGPGPAYLASVGIVALFGLAFLLAGSGRRAA